MQKCNNADEMSIKRSEHLMNQSIETIVIIIGEAFFLFVELRYIN